MSKTYSKLDNNTIQIDEQVITNTSTQIDYDNLVDQRDMAIVSRDEFIFKKNQEIADLDALIKQASSLGIVSKF